MDLGTKFTGQLYHPKLYFASAITQLRSWMERFSFRFIHLSMWERLQSKHLEKGRPLKINIGVIGRAFFFFFRWHSTLTNQNLGNSHQLVSQLPRVEPKAHKCLNQLWSEPMGTDGKTSFLQGRLPEPVLLLMRKRHPILVNGYIHANHSIGNA